jgi:hypothetical protein
MTLTEVAVIIGGLAIGWWIVAVLIPGVRVDRDAPPDTLDGLPPGAERDALPGDEAPAPREERPM